MRRLPAPVLVLALTVLWAGAPRVVVAQSRSQLDAGTFEHRVSGSFAGTETFAIRRQAEDLVAVGRVTREGGAGTLRSLEVGARFDGLGRILRYELHTREGPALHVVVNRTGSRLRVTTNEEDGERFTEFLASEQLLVMEREIAHHYATVARRLRSESDPRSIRLDILIPSESRTVPLQVRGLSRDTLALGEERLSATRYEIRVGGDETLLWIASDDGRILRVAVPARGWEARRVPRP